MTGDIEGYVPSSPGPTTSYLEANPQPVRICDTRPDNPSDLSGIALSQCENKAPGAKGTLVVSVDPANPPASTTAAFVSITATQATKDTYLTAWDGEGTPPTTSVSNPAPGMTETTSALVPLNDGSFGIYNASGTTQVVIDVTGWLVAPSG
jgi:hypothetical protein